jgi:hypothetical protein
MTLERLGVALAVAALSTVVTIACAVVLGSALSRIWRQPMPLFSIIVGLAKLAGEAVVAFATSPLGRLVIVGAAAWLWSGHRERAACEARAEAFRADLQRAADAEHLRRESAIAEARAAGAAEADALARKNLDLEIRLQESADASHAADARPCLSRDSVLRLDRLAR